MAKIMSQNKCFLRRLSQVVWALMTKVTTAPLEVLDALITESPYFPSHSPPLPSYPHTGPCLTGVCSMSSSFSCRRAQLSLVPFQDAAFIRYPMPSLKLELSPCTIVKNVLCKPPGSGIPLEQHRMSTLLPCLQARGARVPCFSQSSLSDIHF